jgi:hypothetical protein
MRKRNSLTFGKQIEMSIISQFLGMGYDVSLPLVDDKGIDCVIRINSKKYFEIQIKSKSSRSKQPFRFAAIKSRDHRNYLYVFYTEKDKKTYFFTPRILKGLSSRNQSGKNKDRLTLDIPSVEPSKNDTKKYKNKYKRAQKYVDKAGYSFLEQFLGT